MGRGSYDFLNSLEGLATLNGANLDGYDFDDFAKKIYSPRGAGDDYRGSSPNRWSTTSLDATSAFFADGSPRMLSARNSGSNSELFESAQRMNNATNASVTSSGGANGSTATATVGLPKKRSMAALR